MFAVRRAADLVNQARRLVAPAGPVSHGTKIAAVAKARQAIDVLGKRRGAGAMLVAAQASEIRAELDDVHELETTVGGLVAAAAMYLEAGTGDEARRGQARVARMLAKHYVKIGMRDRSEAFAMQYLRSLPDGDRDLFAMAYTVSAMEIAGNSAQLLAFVQRRDRDDYPEPLRSVLTILSQRARTHDCNVDELAAAAGMLTHVPADLRIQCVLFAANSLITKKAPGRAVEILTHLRSTLDVDEIQDARVAHALGMAAARAGDPTLALRMHLLAWVRYDDLRYRVGSAPFRRAIDGQLARIRPGALTAAARMSDWRLMLELIESSRLQATLDMPGSIDELDHVLATGDYKERPSTPGVRVVDPASLPDIYHLAVHDLYEARADVDGRVELYVGGVSALADTAAGEGRTGTSVRLDVETVIGRHAAPDDLWWSNWYDSGTVFWVLSRGTVPIDGGVIDIVRDEELQTALSVVLLRSKVEPPWPLPRGVAAVDVEHYLERADAPDELQLTSTLARVLPDAIRAAGDRDRRLFMSVAAELAPVPWPILPVGPAARPATRLIEHFELRFIPSLAVLDRVGDGNSRMTAGDELPLLLTCDYYLLDGVPSPLPSRRAQTVLAARQFCGAGTGVREATALNLIRWLRWLPRGTEGVAFFRAHYQWRPTDPGSSGMQLADEVMPSGLLGAKDAATRQTLLSLPTTVVMSCCSTSGGRERNGGETLGLAPVAMMAGARRLIVTAVDIRHTDFTVALDNMLIELAIRPGNHFTALRHLQLHLLDAWRRWDHRTTTERDLLPRPEIWAQYQAFGA